MKVKEGKAAIQVDEKKRLPMIAPVRARKSQAESGTVRENNQVVISITVSQWRVLGESSSSSISGID